ncbi:uncharacterized protein BT62DRAFT_1073689 [Guyanagaster necrorhizus]|uniref:Uncharacterized protein n=1 Tax=Guyanagaster necrorhizus TaxID=856835 RepID=A0A9P7VX64_9AGAR|nr:uncharacterized protein BT62DRAFT_1073689 [Guyanagaster necrorhizus MCA 3950]KAG7449176.1 hypothetical protein BT62DRAFT_1073689 [Guyanagaster necrorhizus MCA 3950]
MPRCSTSLSWALLFSLASPQFALAVPIGGISNNPSYSLTASLAILLTFLIVLTVLFVLKHIYMKRRRARNLHCDTSASSFAIDSQKSSDSSMLSPLRRMTPSKERLAAFLVGFFGSPIWETSAKAWQNSLSLHESIQSSSMYSLHTQSRSYKTSRSRPTFNEMSSTLNEFGEKIAHLPDFSDSKQSRRLSSPGSLPPCFSLLLPTVPEKARRVPSKHSHDRRLSLPNTPASRKVDGQVSTCQKQHSILKTSTSRRSDSSTVLSPGLRMVYNNNSLEYELPLSSKDHQIFALSVNERLRSDQSNVPPLPPLPQVTPLLPSPVEFRNPESALGRNYISHPYALAPYTKRGNLKQAPRLPFEATHDQSVSKTSCPSPTMSRNSYTFIPPPPQFTQVPPLPPLPLPLPLPPREPIPALPKARPNTRSLSVRSRKSPPIGPSPLRTMTLPESVIGDLFSLPSLPDPPNTNEYQNPNNSYTARLSRRSYSTVGLGFPPVSCAPPDDPKVDSAKRSSTDSTSSKRTDGDGSNLLLSIIREPVEETSQWDTSLCMDDKFESMIETAGNENNGQRGLEKCESVTE